MALLCFVFDRSTSRRASSSVSINICSMFSVCSCSLSAQPWFCLLPDGYYGVLQSHVHYTYVEQWHYYTNSKQTLHTDQQSLHNINVESSRLWPMSTSTVCVNNKRLNSAGIIIHINNIEHIEDGTLVILLCIS